jgi:hypothetical protein
MITATAAASEEAAVALEAAVAVATETAVEANSEMMTLVMISDLMIRNKLDITY